MRHHLLTLLLLLPPSIGSSQTAAAGKPSSWRDEAKKVGLSEDEQAHLADDKVLVSRHEIKQSFSAYLGSPVSSFVTSDAVLNAYHVLFEETLRQQEMANAIALQRYVPELWRLVTKVRRFYRGDQAVIDTAHQRACFVTGVAAGLLGTKIEGVPDALRKAIEAEVIAIEKAEGQRKPERLGKPEPDFIAFDYTLLKPTGFYTETPEFQRYFRAVRWLQLVPFRVGRHEELLAALMMDAAIDNADAGMDEAGGDKERNRIEGIESEFERSQRVWSMFGFLKQEGWLAKCANSSSPDKVTEIHAAFFDLEAKEMRERLDVSDSESAANDRVREPPAPRAKESELRLLCGLVLPEDKALRQSGRVANKAGHPAGLEFAAWLGLPLAERLVSSGNARERMPIIEGARPERSSRENRFDSNEKPSLQRGWQVIDETSGVCWAQMHALRGLWEFDARTPDFMKTDAWQIKTLMTINSSWAQHRHAWILQAKPDVYYLGMTKSPEAFVEPAPEFFQRLASVCTEMFSIATLAEEQQDPVAMLDSELADMVLTFRNAASDDLSFISAYGRLSNLSMMLGFQLPDARSDDKLDTSKLLPVIEHERKLIASRDPARIIAIMQNSRHLPRGSARLWTTLETTCLRLALLCHKQLDKKTLSKAEMDWLKQIGEQLAAVMLYGGNSYLTPLDDAPRIARVSSDQVTGNVLQVGIGRPRLMYVLYPWQGAEVLCRGVVMPYHELNERATLNDTEWRKRFEQGQRPPVPEWLKSIVPVEDIKLDSEE